MQSLTPQDSHALPLTSISAYTSPSPTFPSQPIITHIPPLSRPKSTMSDTASIATTTTPLLPSSAAAQQAADYSFTGRPLRVPAAGRDTKANPALQDLCVGDAGFAAGAAGAAGANVAPPRFDGGRMVSVPVRKADLDSASASAAAAAAREGGGEEGKGKKRGLFGRRKKDEDGFVMVQMSSAEYRAYWAKGTDGTWLEGVTEPEGGRAEWVRSRMEKQ